jgi:hypothetical protein
MTLDDQELTFNGGTGKAGRGQKLTVRSSAPDPKAVVAILQIIA